MNSSAMITVQRAKKGAACKECARRKRKCNHSALTTHRKGALTFQKSAPLFHVPASIETQLCHRFLDTIRCLRLDHLWLNMVPCRLGTNEVVDNAITALVRNRDHAMTDDTAIDNGGLQNYIRAVVRLRHQMDTPECSISDNVLLTVALLCVCEALMKSDMFMCFAHWCGMRAILLSRPRSYPVSDLSRGILYHIRNQTFHIPVAMGTASPFDEPRWYTLEPAAHHDSTPESLRLKRSSHELLIRIPRLIVLLRQLRQTTDVSVKEHAIDLAHELAGLQNDEAESGLLHGVKVIKTTDEEQRALVPFSFEYPNLGQMETAVVYWKYLLLLLNISLKVEELFPGSGFDVNHIKAEMKRIGANITMSWQYAKTRRQRAHSKGHVAFPTALLILYGIYRHMDEFRGVPVDRWRKWTLDRQNEVNTVWSLVSTEDDLNEANELFLGGPLTGLFVAAYAEIPFWVRYQYPQQDET